MAKTRKIHYPDPKNNGYTICGKIWNYKPGMTSGAPTSKSPQRVTCGTCAKYITRVGSGPVSFNYLDLI